MGHTLACATSLKVQEIIQRDNLLDNVKKLGNALKTELETHFKNHPFIGDIRGRGLFIGVELVEDRTTKKPFSPEKSINTKIKKLALEKGLMCYPMGGTIDGQNGDHVMLAPPFIMEEKHIDFIVSTLASSIDEVTKS
jgi:adenosylmethionine-8-amino-7-oxononanoate aminotransferase